MCRLFEPQNFCGQKLKEKKTPGNTGGGGRGEVNPTTFPSCPGHQPAQADRMDGFAWSDVCFLVHGLTQNAPFQRKFTRCNKTCMPRCNSIAPSMPTLVEQCLKAKGEKTHTRFGCRKMRASCCISKIYIQLHPLPPLEAKTRKAPSAECAGSPKVARESHIVTVALSSSDSDFTPSCLHEGDITWFLNFHRVFLNTPIRNHPDHCSVTTQKKPSHVVPGQMLNRLQTIFNVLGGSWWSQVLNVNSSLGHTGGRQKISLDYFNDCSEC